jgi:hypothetical protein
MVSDVENGLIGVKSEGVEYAVLREVGWYSTNILCDPFLRKQPRERGNRNPVADYQVKITSLERGSNSQRKGFYPTWKQTERRWEEESIIYLANGRNWRQNIGGKADQLRANKNQNYSWVILQIYV